MKQLKVDAIKNGTVIDHIPAGKALNVYEILSPKTKKVTTIGMNLTSKTHGRKDLIKIEGLESNPPCLIPHEKFPEKEIPKFFKKKIRLTRNSIGQLRTSLSIQDLEDQNQWLQIKFNNLENRMIERDEMVFKWMEAVENELHSLGIDLNKIREIFFMKNNEEDIDE